MLSLIRRNRRFFLGTLLAGLALRLVFFIYYPAVTDDSRIYADFAGNWLHHGIYGTTQAGQIVATDERLPGYPAFLAFVFTIFGANDFRAVMLIQILVDLGTCLLIADLARRAVSERAAPIAFLLSALCPFLANYAAAVLTETLEIFFTALALDCALAGIEFLRRGDRRATPWIGAGLAIAAGILLRPDGGILLIAVALYFAWTLLSALRERIPGLATLYAALIVGACALLPLVPWTVRNLRTLGHFQPLAPRYATAADELADPGFNRWVRTWIADYASVEEIYWSVPGDKIDADKLPSRAFDSPSQEEATRALIEDYNESLAMNPQLDARFRALAGQRIHEHPLRYVLGLPALRIADMWLRPRTELLPPDVRWWEFDDDIKGSVLAVALGAINLLYVLAAFAALFRGNPPLRFFHLLLVFVVIRSLFLGTLENPETRYTLECYPVVIALASRLFSDWKSTSTPPYRPS